MQKSSLTSSALDKILGDVQVVSDYLTITSSESSTTFSGKGDSGEVDIALESSQDEIQELSVQQESTGTYSLEYLNPIIKAVGSSVDSVTCEYSSSKTSKSRIQGFKSRPNSFLFGSSC